MIVGEASSVALRGGLLLDVRPRGLLGCLVVDIVSLLRQGLRVWI